jgi:SAM-dependent methyltransferase
MSANNGHPTDLPLEFVPGNQFDKYRSRNLIHRWMMRGFLRSARELLRRAGPVRVLEVGCGAGDLALHLLGPSADDGSQPEYVGIDVSAEEVAKARAQNPGRSFQTESIYHLPFPDRDFDLVLACEVFEHLERPAEALAEVQRVCAGHLLLSVPWEPLWRVLNVVRGKYVRSWGNTPGHVQHFTRRAIRRLVATRFEILDVRKPLPWTMLLARRVDHAAAPGATE